MKNKLNAFLLIVTCTLFTASSCHKSQSSNPIDQLPPATDTGANTFGCLINGQVFIPKGSPLSGPHLQCAYQYLHDNFDTGYFFQLSGSDLSNTSDFKSVGIFTDSLQINQGDVIVLANKFVYGEAYGQYGRYIIGINPDLYNTNSTYKGQLKINKFDEVNQIVSGTFSFTAINVIKDTIKITDGRFDMHYTR